MARIQLYALICAAFALGLLGIYSAGIARGQDKIRRRLDERRITNLTTAKEVDDEITTADDPRLIDAANEWVRQNGG